MVERAHPDRAAADDDDPDVSTIDLAPVDPAQSFTTKPASQA